MVAEPPAPPVRAPQALVAASSLRRCCDQSSAPDGITWFTRCLPSCRRLLAGCRRCHTDERERSNDGSFPGHHAARGAEALHGLTERDPIVVHSLIVALRDAQRAAQHAAHLCIAETANAVSAAHAAQHCAEAVADLARQTTALAQRITDRSGVAVAVDVVIDAATLAAEAAADAAGDAMNAAAGELSAHVAARVAAGITANAALIACDAAMVVLRAAGARRSRRAPARRMPRRRRTPT